MGVANFTMGKGDEGKIMGQGPFGTSYFLRGALAGGICCSFTHGAACPIDVVKTRMQLDPVKYNKGLIGGFRQVIAEEGAIALSTGLGPTAQGYFVQGWFKFGGVEFFKIQFVKSLQSNPPLTAVLPSTWHLLLWLSLLLMSSSAHTRHAVSVWCLTQHTLTA